MRAFLFKPFIQFHFSRPPVSRIAAVKRAPPSYDSDDNDQVAEENEYASEGEQQLVQEEVVGEV